MGDEEIKTENNDDEEEPCVPHQSPFPRVKCVCSPVSPLNNFQRDNTSTNVLQSSAAGEGPPLPPRVRPQSPFSRVKCVCSPVSPLNNFQRDNTSTNVLQSSAAGEGPPLPPRVRPCDIDSEYPLHHCAFIGNYRHMAKLVCCKDKEFVSRQDHYGNTALHLAVMLGEKECIDILLAKGVPVKTKNKAGWNCIAEAVSYGDRTTLVKLMKKMKHQSRDTLDSRRPHVVEALLKMPDFSMQFKWEMQSWIPLISRLLPSDVCHLRKKGCKLRLDTTLTEFTDNRWERGDLTFIFNGEKKPRHSLHILDNERKIFQRCRYEETEKEVENEADLLMSSDSLVAHLNADRVQFVRDKMGFLWREARTEDVGRYRADFYHVTNLVLESRKRREHLTDEDVKKNKEILETFRKGALSNNIEIERRHSLPAPRPRTRVTWEQYRSGNIPPGTCSMTASASGVQVPCLGRTVRVKEFTKTFKATIAMSEDFPMKVTDLLDILELIAPFKHFTRLREFLMYKLPAGFPVRIDIPVFPSITARVTFQTMDFKEDLPDSLFSIPQTYKLDPISRVVTQGGDHAGVHTQLSQR